LKDLTPVIEKLSSAVVVCAGDVMLDSFIYGDVSRISPEAPIPVLRTGRRQSMLGGAGNALRNLSALGCGVRFFSATGEDTEAAEISTLIADLPGTCASLQAEPGRQTPSKTRYIAQGQQLLRADNESTDAVKPETAATLLAAFTAALQGCSVVLLSDYAKGLLNGSRAQEFILAARAAGKPVIVDPKGRDFSRYRNATLLKPNLRELAEATGLSVSGAAAQEIAARQLLNHTAAESILVTLGAEGMMLIPANGPAIRFPALAREVYDVSGAGDTVAAVLAAAVGSGASFHDAVEVANIAAGMVVGRAGTAVVSAVEIAEEVRRSQFGYRTPAGAAAKVLSLPDAIERSQTWMQSGLVVGFTNGCFDLLHPGHLRLLETARAHCDRLLVGLNSDQSVKRLKGDSRPVQDEMSRALILASLSCIDGVVIFGEDTPLELIRALRPNLLVKGGEYKPHEVVGAGDVENWGGKLLLVDMIPGWSTTRTVSRMTPLNENSRS
jgi:D-beta-D-heptose 7-phosphate kinase / D-beta-D-heptose 1-phosphate adenosyltransferase